MNAMPREKEKSWSEEWEEVKSWTTILINGIEMNRRKVKKGQYPGDKCPGCGANKLQYHSITHGGCEYELSPCGKHKSLIECDCPASDKDTAV